MSNCKKNYIKMLIEYKKQFRAYVDSIVKQRKNNSRNL